MTNREIDRHIIAVAHGDKEALRALYLALRKPVFVLALTIGHDQSMAEDVVQDTFVAVCERSHMFRARGKGQPSQSCRNCAKRLAQPAAHLRHELGERAKAAGRNDTGAVATAGG